MMLWALHVWGVSCAKFISVRFSSLQFKMVSVRFKMVSMLSHSISAHRVTIIHHASVLGPPWLLVLWLWWPYRWWLIPHRRGFGGRLMVNSRPYYGCPITQTKERVFLIPRLPFVFCTAICPRNHSKFFKHILDTKQEIQADIEEFFEEVINGDFTEEEGCCEFRLY